MHDECSFYLASSLRNVLNFLRLFHFLIRTGFHIKTIKLLRKREIIIDFL